MTNDNGLTEDNRAMMSGGKLTGGELVSENDESVLRTTSRF